MRQTYSQLVIEYFNSRPLRSKVKRKDFLDTISFHRPFFSEKTVDTYRSILTKEGYLAKTNERGTYKIVKRIPKTQTIGNLKDGQQAWKESRVV